MFRGMITADLGVMFNRFFLRVLDSGILDITLGKNQVTSTQVNYQDKLIPQVIVFYI